MISRITPLILVLTLLTLCCNAAITVEDFESWTGGGTAVVDPDDAGNTVLALAPGQAVEIDLPVTVGIIRMDVYDFGEAAPHPTSAYGPRWGVLGSDSLSNPLSVAASIIYRPWINGGIGYGMSPETSQTGSWWSPSYFGGPRQCTLETWTDSDSDGTLDTDLNNGSGQWTTWTFEVFADGTAEIRAPIGPYGQIAQSVWSDDSDMAMENLDKVWFSGGRSDLCVGPVASGTYAGYSVLIDNITVENTNFDSTPGYQDNFDPGWDAATNQWRVATWVQNGTQMSYDRCDEDGMGHLVQTVLAGGPPYYGGSMQSRVEYPYGRWVASLKPSSVAGALNSMFTNDWDDMTTPGDYSDGSHFEVDIEFLTYTFGASSGYVHLAVHCDGYSNLYSQNVPLDFNPSDAYHEWGFDILPSCVRWHVDGEIFATFEKPSYVDFPEDYEMFFNSWTDTGWINGPPAQDADYLIDWVKFYPLITGVPGNADPVADAGSDQNVNDTDDNGYESVTLNGTGSSDSDGTIVSYVWTEGATQIATGSQPTVSLAVGTHTITLTVTDDDSATDTDTVVITVTGTPNADPVADAGSDQNVTDTDDNGYESVTLNGTGSSDSDGTIASYVWSEGATQVATGSQPTVSLAVGTHTITLTVTDDDSATDTDTVVITVNASPASSGIQLDLSTAFNMDAWCGPLEFQQCRTDIANLITLYGTLVDGIANYTMDQNDFLIVESAAMPYSISGDYLHPSYVTSAQGSPADGIVYGADRDYHIAGSTGNNTYSGDWTEAVDPSTYDLQENCIVIGAKHNYNDWQISSVTYQLPVGLQDYYEDINFLLAAQDVADKARNMRIVALYGDGTDTEVLYSFSTANGGSGPVMKDATGGTDFASALTMTRAYNNPTGTTGALFDTTTHMWEFALPLTLDDTKVLWGLRFEDSDPTLNWNARGLTIFAATLKTDGASSP